MTLRSTSLLALALFACPPGAHAPDEDIDDSGLFEEVEGPPPELSGCAEEVVEDRGRLALDAERFGVELEDCARHRYSVVAAAGAQLVVRVTGAEAALLWPDASGWQAPLAWSADDELRLEVPRSGELALEVRGKSGEYDLALRCEEGCQAVPRFPVVLVHGWTGWDDVQSYTYFYGVEADLSSRGVGVFVPALDPYNSCEVRSEQLAEQVDALLVTAHHRKVNLIAHSQGGLDSRRMISTLGYGDRVATLTTISTPHRGTPLADIVLASGPGEELVSWFLEWLGATTVESQSNATASFVSLSEATVQGSFNADNPDDPRVLYRSWAGHTCTLGWSCDDLCDVEIQLPHQILTATSGDNDGIVPVSSAIWGDYRGEIAADHFDEVGQLLGVTGPHFDHLDFYASLAQELAVSGH